MYVVPRPEVEDDPLYAVRLAAGSVIGFALIPLLQPSLPPLLAAVPVALMAGMRKAFDPKKAFGAPIAFIVMVWLISMVVSLTRPMPLVLVSLMGLLYFVGFYVIQRTGNPMGMLVLVVTVLMSVMGMESTVALEAMRDGFYEACFVALFMIPILYAVFPSRARVHLVETYTPAPGPHALGAAIRAGVLLLTTLWLYTVSNASNMILGVVAAQVLVFPTRETLFGEARERAVSVLLGAAVAFAALAVLTITAHLYAVILLVFLAGLFFGSRMMRGHYPSMVYQTGLTVTLALVAGALSTQEPGYAALTRIVLTLLGALVAALLAAVLEALLVPSSVRSAGVRGFREE